MLVRGARKEKKTYETCFFIEPDFDIHPASPSSEPRNMKICLSILHAHASVWVSACVCTHESTCDRMLAHELFYFLKGYEAFARKKYPYDSVSNTMKKSCGEAIKKIGP